MKKSFFTLLLCFGLMMSYGQLKVVSSGQTQVKKDLLVGEDAAHTDARIEIGTARTANGNAYFDLISDISNFPDYGGRLIRFGNGLTSFTHRGPSNLEFNSADGGSLVLKTTNNERLRINNVGNVGIGTSSPTANLSVNGTANKPGGGDWGMFSDKRLKKNIEKFTDGIEQLMQINPVVYQYNGKANIEDTETKHVGVIAQELEKVASYMVESVPVIEIQKKGNDETYSETSRTVGEYLHVDATAIRYMLVNAAKEHEKDLQEKQNEIDDLKARLEKLESLLIDGTTLGEGNQGIVESEITLGNIERATLEQNRPNPFTDFTSISYNIPANSKASSIEIYDINGQLYKTVDIDHTGEGILNVRAGDLTNGIYSYRLVVDGQVIATNKMIKTQ